MGQYLALPLLGPVLFALLSGMARGFALAGDTANAKKAFQDFFELWKDADREVPILQQAKAEYAALR